MSSIDDDEDESGPDGTDLEGDEEWDGDDQDENGASRQSIWIVIGACVCLAIILLFWIL